MNDMLGHNAPPSAAEGAEETAKALSDWLGQNPVIADEATAQAAKLHLDRGKLGLQELEAARVTEVEPLNRQVAAINDRYRSPSTLLKGVLTELSARFQAYLFAEEERRKKAVEEAQAAAAAADEAAKEAFAREQDAASNAKMGVLDVDISAAVKETNEKLKQVMLAERALLLAERESRVKVGGGFLRATGLRGHTTLLVTDACIAINAIGMTAHIAEAICKGARAYKREYGEWPPGIEARIERKV